MSAPTHAAKSPPPPGYTAPESPTTARPLEMDDDDFQEPGLTGEESSQKALRTTATTMDAPASGEPPPPKPPRPTAETQQNEKIKMLQEAFPSIEPSVVRAVLTASGGRIEPAFNALLQMTDPDAAQLDQPPPPPPRPVAGPLGNTSTTQAQLEADELYARQLAEHYENVGAYEQRTARSQNRGRALPRGRQQAGLDPDQDDREYSFIDDELPVIKENLRKGFVETQNKFNSWITTLKKRIDGQFDERPENEPGHGSDSFIGRPTRDQSRRSAEYDRYDADPELLSDDFAGMKFHNDGTPMRAQPSPNLFKPPPPSKSPRSANGRKVAFCESVDDFDAYEASPRIPAKDAQAPVCVGAAAKTSKWQPLSPREPNPIAENDPFSLGDSEDDKDVHSGQKETGLQDAGRLRLETSEAMADSLVEGKSPSAPSNCRSCLCCLTYPAMKFGKQIQKRQLEVPEYAASFVNYKALKKLIKKLSATPTLSAQHEPIDSQAALQANKANFFFHLERELEKVNAFYLQKEAELKQFVEVNGTAFSKILKKWDKTSKSKTKELYLSRAVEVQPFFNPTVISELSDQATTSLQELGAWAEGDNVNFEGRPDHILSSQHLLGTDEGDADTLLLDTVLSGNIDSLRDSLGRMRGAAESNGGVDISLMERVTRTFLTSVNQGPLEALQVLLETGLVDIQSEDDINERNCLHQAAIYGNSFVLQYALSKGVAVGRTDVYGRVPLHYASMHGRIDMLDALVGADPQTIDLIDHDNFTPLVHAIARGHLFCVQRLLEKNARIDPVSEADHVPLNLACEHGSLAIVELLLKHGAEILPDAEGLYPHHLVARSGQTPQLLLLLRQYGADLDQVDKLYGWTPLIHAVSSDLIPKNIMLPFQKDTRLASFQIDNLDSFTLDFDVFPAYGAKVIAKTVALPNAFRALPSSSGSCCLPLFDPRLRAIGQISFQTQVIKPFRGKPLEVTDFETYWKATSQVDRSSLGTFVTGSSLSGEFVRLYVQHTSDGVPVLWPYWTITCGSIDVPISRITVEQFTKVTAHSAMRAELSQIRSLPHDQVARVHDILRTAGATLHEALSLVPRRMHVNVQVLYPTVEEERFLDLGPAADINAFVDAILTIVFNHARQQRAQSHDSVRSVVFSSYTPSLCTAINWKQPNFPVFLCNDLGVEPPISTKQPVGPKSGSKRAGSIKETARVARSNNLMGLICRSCLLDMVPALVDAIKSHGLYLVVDKSADDPRPEITPFADPFPRLPNGIDGVLKRNGVLRFNESINV
ncbi:hypothetical protein P8C59_000127 [Phyllachora maydis]|uniref:Uncharacterized protein n=1 Tax=Phyllachora maydis TaxID=1825666 RepID=A0AAD9HX08_9PEZI|nr:hypothetical protein P8C59_000127 [Phyllachora maydis]